MPNRRFTIATTLTLLIISIVCLNYRSVRWIGVGYLTVVALIFPVQFLIAFCVIVAATVIYLKIDSYPRRLRHKRVDLDP